LYKEINNKNILVIITGSIAAYKACEVIRILRKNGASIQVMMTKSAQQFVGQTTFTALSNNPVIVEQFSESPKAGLEHIDLAISLDAIVVVPATENILCKVASGVADDVTSTTLSVCEQPTLYVPAMNFRMWQNQATIEAVKKLRSRNKIIMNPSEGQLASLHSGDGRLPDITSIMNNIRGLFRFPLPLNGKKVLVTAGPTRESIDPVRFISNRSSGKMGYALAECAKNMGAKVILISGPTALIDIPEVIMVKIETALEMKKAVVRNCEKADFIFMAAAVSDYMPIKNFNKKIKRDSKLTRLELTPAPDILKLINNKTKAIKIGFALETHNGKEESIRKMKDKNIDFIVLNYANEEGAGFDSNTNHVFIFNKKGEHKELKMNRKEKIAHEIIDHVIKNK